MIDFYKMRGYPPIYTMEWMLEKKSASWSPYEKRSVQPNTQPRTIVRRFAKPRSKGGKFNRFEVKNLKVGDVVYSVVCDSYGGGKYGNTTGSKKHIQPYVVAEIDDCYMWSRKKITDNKRGYCTYVWVVPLVKVNGRWINSKYKDRNRRHVGFGHSVSINDEVFMTPEEAMWNEMSNY